MHSPSTRHPRCTCNRRRGTPGQTGNCPAHMNPMAATQKLPKEHHPPERRARQMNSRRLCCVRGSGSDALDAPLAIWCTLQQAAVGKLDCGRSAQRRGSVEAAARHDSRPCAVSALVRTWDAELRWRYRDRLGSVLDRFDDRSFSTSLRRRLWRRDLAGTDPRAVPGCPCDLPSHEDLEAIRRGGHRRWPGPPEAPGFRPPRFEVIQCRVW